ncbi:hypothetical protein [Alcanivorax sp. NBRC 102024]|uniref:hypothetical protein n=1 Tax=Alcanivorax sp. NBRC 102024 TaxID=1113895 RepID=UPI000789CAF8|nr:hypothetical protein [Alcanivorax sp. NBRC 102024]
MDVQLSTIALADRLKLLIGKESLYALANELGVSWQCVKNWYSRGTVMDDETGIKIAERLRMNPETVVLWLQVERMEKKGNDKLSQLWRHIAEQKAA